jgi:hypothetical protein
LYPVNSRNPAALRLLDASAGIAFDEASSFSSLGAFELLVLDCRYGTSRQVADRALPIACVPADS